MGDKFVSSRCPTSTSTEDSDEEMDMDQLLADNEEDTTTIVPAVGAGSFQPGEAWIPIRRPSLGTLSVASGESRSSELGRLSLGSVASTGGGSIGSLRDIYLKKCADFGLDASVLKSDRNVLQSGNTLNFRLVPHTLMPLCVLYSPVLPQELRNRGYPGKGSCRCHSAGANVCARVLERQPADSCRRPAVAAKARNIPPHHARSVK